MKKRFVQLHNTFSAGGEASKMQTAKKQVAPLAENIHISLQSAKNMRYHLQKKCCAAAQTPTRVMQTSHCRCTTLIWNLFICLVQLHRVPSGNAK